MSRVLVITPTYNERANLERFTEGLFAVLPTSNLLIIDDGSPDGTGALADRLAEADSRIRVMHRGCKLGLGTAYLDGFRDALSHGYDIVVQMDTDLSHDPRHLPAFLAAIEEGADLVLGSRNVKGGGVEGWGPVRHFVSKGGSLYSRAVLGMKVRDLTSGYKAFRREVLERLDLDGVRSDGYSFQIEMTWRAVRHGFRVCEIPITFVDRRAGQSKFGWPIFIEGALMVWKLRFEGGA